MRELTDHKTNELNDKLIIAVVDEPGAGGANHKYEISGFDPAPGFDTSSGVIAINFQNGTIPENGTNGVTQEVLLAIVIDRLRSFQDGPFANDYNQTALDHCNEALAALKARTTDRVARGVEGKHAA